MNAVLGESCEPCEILCPGIEYEVFQQGFSSLPPAVAEELFRPEPSPDVRKLKQTVITVDNTLSPAYTLLHIHCVSQKGLLYDILRTLKDCNIQVSLPSSISAFFFPCLGRVDWTQFLCCTIACCIKSTALLFFFPFPSSVS